MQFSITRSRVTVAILAALVTSLLWVPPANAAPEQVAGVTLEWAFNGTIQTTWSGAIADGGPDVACHFLSAGRSEGREDTYASQAGSVTILKQVGMDGDDVVVEQPTFANRCLRVVDGRIGQSVRWSDGHGTLDRATGEATIRFDGILSANFNNHRSPIHIADPVLSVAADGSAELVATASGYRGAQGSPERELLEPMDDVVVASFADVAASADGFTATPDFFGVEVTVVDNFPADPPTTITVPSQSVQDGKGVDDQGDALWGSWPEAYVEYMYRTGVNSYFHSSNANPTHAGDAAKAPLPMTVTYPEQVGDDQQTVTVVVPDTGPGEFLWTINGAGAVDLGDTTDHGGYLQATGGITPIDVKDTREGGPEWSISGQVSDFTGGLSGGHLGWTPLVVTPGAGAVAGAPVGSVLDGGSGLVVPSLLASATAGHERGVARVGADLDLRLPVETPPGTYTAVLTITALS